MSDDNKNNTPQSPSQLKASIEQTKERDDFRRRLKEQDTIRQTFENHPIKLKVSPDVVMSAVGTVRFDADGVPHAGGVTLAQAIENYAKVNSFTVAENLLEAHAPENLIKSKQDLKSVHEKSIFIERHGLAAFENLPSTPRVVIKDEDLTWATYIKLPIREKSRISVEKGESFIAGLKQRDQEQAKYDRLIGKPYVVKK